MCSKRRIAAQAMVSMLVSAFDYFVTYLSLIGSQTLHGKLTVSQNPSGGNDPEEAVSVSHLSSLEAKRCQAMYRVLRLLQRLRLLLGVFFNGVVMVGDAARAMTPSSVFQLLVPAMSRTMLDNLISVR